MGSELAVLNGTTVVKAPELSQDTMSTLVLNGDLSKLNPSQKVAYYRAFCGRVGLDPATQPFKLLRLQGKEILYCDRGGTAQLNKKHEVSHKITERRKEDDLYIVTAQAATKDGRCTESIGAVAIAGLKGESLANAIMKAETKAKRRSTLDLLGLGMLDESEVDSIQGAIPAGTLEQPQEIAAQELPPPQGASPEEQTAWRKLRAALNKSLTAGKTSAEMAEKRKAFEDYTKKGHAIWNHLTHHNEVETFGMLFDSHLERVKRDEDLAGPEGIQIWLRGLSEVSTVGAFAGFVKHMRENERFQIGAVEEALHDKALQLGLNAYSEVEDEGEDREMEFMAPK